MGYLIAAVVGYLMGCASMAYYISLRRKKDIRSAGSGNLGASNTVVLFGWGAGALVALCDIGKGLASVLLMKWLFPELEYVGAVAGIACVLGHIFPFYLKFRGGKGLASYFGMTLALNWKLAIAVALLIIAVTLITDYIALGTISTVVVVPTYLAITTGSLLLVGILCVGSVVMLGKHWVNLVRIWNHQEIGLRSTARGENWVR